MQKQTCLKKVTKSGGKRLSHLLIDKADNAKDFSIRFKRMVGLKLLPSFFDQVSQSTLCQLLALLSIVIIQ